MYALEKLDIAPRAVRSNSTLSLFSAFDGNMIGGLLQGIGMGLTGACAGTVLPQLAAGVSSSRWTALGGLLGGMGFAKVGSALVRTDALPQRPTFASTMHVAPETALLVFEVFTLAAVGLSGASLPGKAFAQYSTVTGGLMIGVAQTVSILLTASPLGVSAAYEQAGRYIWRLLGFTEVAKPTSPPRSLVLAAGILVGSVAVNEILGLGTPSATLDVPPLQGLVGGFVLTFGARMAGGCTSGHGLSGMAALSYSSLLTTAAMFGGGIAAQWLLS